MGWTTRGKVNVTLNSAVVTGVGSLFLQDGRIGDGFRGPDGRIYEVTNIATNTGLTIQPPYEGPTVNNATYFLAPFEGYVKDTADALRAASIAIGQLPLSKQDKSANLSALSGLSGSANTVPYFTGVGALSLAALTAAQSASAMSLPLGALTRVSETGFAASSNSGFYTDDTSLNIDTLPGGWRGLVATSLQGAMPPLAGGLFWLDCQQTYSGQSCMQTAVQYGGSETDPNIVSLAPSMAIRIRNQPGTAWGPWGKITTNRDTVASNADQTAGKFLTVGYQGLGADDAPPLTDMNLPFGSGFSWATAGTANMWSGFASGSNFLTASASTAEVAQIGFSRSSPLRVAARRKTSGNWQPLVEIIHTGNVGRDPAFNTGGVVSSTAISGYTVTKFFGGFLVIQGTGTITESIAANTVSTRNITIPAAIANLALTNAVVNATPTTSEDFGGVTSAQMTTATNLRFTIKSGATAQTYTPRITIFSRWQ